MAHRTELLIIDAQNDFCDLPDSWCPVDPASGQPLRPALPVPGAHADLLRLAAFIDAAGDQLAGITVTLDAHHRHHVAHPPYWRGRGGAPVAPFTSITAAQVRAGDYAPAVAGEGPRTLAYLDALEASGRYTLMVWPVHCQLGSWGHGLHAAVLAACNAWEDRHHRPVQVVAKGSHPWTEHYSALQAEVPDPAEPATGLNTALLQRLQAADTLLVAGQASSHCVKATVEHLLAHGNPGLGGRLVLLTDAMSPVAGFEAQAAAFLADMRRLGVRCQSLAQVQACWPVPGRAQVPPAPADVH
jgi:nicotinamidase-related amidase